MGSTRLLAAVVAVLLHSGSASKLNGQTICRHGTERPCYKVSYVEDGQRRLTFEDARRACRLDGGELLSIETENEQRLIERFIQQLRAGDGDFWIGLRRSPQRYVAGSGRPGCPSQYYWLDGSKAKFRNWHWDEPSCGGEMCVVLYHQPSAPPDEEGHFLFQWNDDNCGSKNNFVCKYPEEKTAVFTGDGNSAHGVPSLKPNILPTTEVDERIKMAFPESSVSFSDGALPVSYILYATIPALLLLSIAVAGFFCYRQQAKRRKTERETHGGRLKQWKSAAAPPCPIQGPYAFSDISKLSHAALDRSVAGVAMTKYPCGPRHDSQCGDYENVPCVNRESGFVTNDIYESSRAESGRGRAPAGWVENEIYG